VTVLSVFLEVSKFRGVYVGLLMNVMAVTALKTVIFMIMEEIIFRASNKPRSVEFPYDVTVFP
jgi:hypothetical protein